MDNDISAAFAWPLAVLSQNMRPIGSPVPITGHMGCAHPLLRGSLSDRHAGLHRVLFHSLRDFECQDHVIPWNFCKVLMQAGVKWPFMIGNISLRSSYGDGFHVNAVCRPGGTLQALQRTSSSVLPFLGGSFLNSSASPSTRFMCLSKAMNLRVQQVQNWRQPFNDAAKVLCSRSAPEHVS